MSGSLDRFLGGSEEEPNDLAPEPAAPEPEPQEQEPEVPEPEPEPEGQAPAEPEEPQARDQKGRFVPLRAVEDERGKRQAAEAERDRLKAELDAFRRQQQAPQAPQPQYQQPQQPLTPEEEKLHERANFSELALRTKLGDEEVEKLIQDAIQEMPKDPTIVHHMRTERFPYQWLHRHMQQLRARQEVGDDPVAYRARIVAEERAKWEAEMATQQQAAPRVSPAAGMQPSVGRARSVAGRTVVDDSDLSLGDILRR